nr:alpha-amylase family glycosyl hydrolase [uncultured Draconibacterium sp.]
MHLFKKYTLGACIIIILLNCCKPFSKREKIEPDFSWDNATVYFLFTDRFCNGNSSNDSNYGRRNDYGNDTLNAATFHGGDIAGIIQKLEEGYFTDLGVNAIWLTGVYEQIHGWVGGGEKNDFPHYSYHGYYPQDLTCIDKNFGTIEEFRTFVNLAHSKGIRVVMDAGLNHAGYATLLDAVKFDFGGVNLSPEEAVDFIPGQDYQNKFAYNDASSWENWWGSDWIRSQKTESMNVLTESIEGLPDFKTESSEQVKIPMFLQNKWKNDSNQLWSVPAALNYRISLDLAPAEYLIQWLASWVREFGIDGFRCDVVENVELFRWRELNDACNNALQEWRGNNPELPESTWESAFWMTGDIWDSSIQYRPKYASSGFNSIVNFTFPKDGNLKTIGETWQCYADSLNSRDDWNALSFLNNTYKRDVDISNMVNCGTALLLSPGAIQIYYGDEVARKKGAGQYLSDSIQGYRSDYPWNRQDLKVLKHWQILGRFRNRHLAVGAGIQKRLGEGVFARIYERGKQKDGVVIAFPECRESFIQVGDVFEERSEVINAYTGEISTVTNHQVHLVLGSKVALLEAY